MKGLIVLNSIVIMLSENFCHELEHFEEPLIELLQECSNIAVHDMESELIQFTTTIISVGANESPDLSRMAFQVDCALTKDIQVDNLLSSMPVTFKSNIFLTRHNSSLEINLPIMTIARNPQYQFLHIGKHENFLTVKLSCLGFKTTVNMFNSIKEQWARPIAMDNLNLQKLCNFGNHPLYGKTLTASTYSIPPYSFVSNNTVLGGSSVDLFKAVGEHYGFKPKLVATLNSFYQLPNGSFGGALGEALYGRVDLALELAFNVGINFGTLANSDHTQNYIYIELKPKEKPRFSNIAFPFDKTTWIMTIVSFLALSLALWFTTSNHNWKTFGSSFQLMFGIIFQEFHESREKRKKSYTLVRILWVLTSLFLTMAFLANLKSSLMKKQYEKRTMTLDEMVDKDMRISASPTYANYMESLDGRAGRLNARILCQIKKHDSVLDTNENVELIVLEEIFKQHPGTKITLERIFQLQTSAFRKSGKEFPFVAIPEKYRGQHICFFFRKFDPRVEYFNLVIRSLTETGVAARLISKWMPPDVGMEDEVGASEEPLVMEHFLIPYSFCVTGLGFGLVAFFFEKIDLEKRGGLLDLHCCQTTIVKSKN